MAELSGRRKVSAWELRRLFNAGGYEDLVARGELVASCASSKPPHTSLNQPAGSLSEIWHYYTPQLVKVAVVHQIVLPDGSLLNGRADPKALWVGGEMLYC